MTSMYDVLKASKGLPVDNIFAELWGRKLSSDYTIDVYTGTLPAILSGTKAGYLQRYKIYGNTEQTGTPTPENPIEPSECGEKTENEAWTGWAQDYVTRINTATRAAIETIDGRTCLRFVVSAGTGDYDNKYIFKTDWKENTRYTFSFKALRLSTESTASVMQVWYTDGSSEYFPRTINSGAFESYTFTTAVNKTVKYITPIFTSGSFRIDIDTFMVNEGSTALPYEPYGYKLPLTSAGQSVDIYIGDDTLSTEEYVDSGTGKIYHMVDGVLTPVDPPAPFPQIPTSAGSTTISWTGEGLAPSEVELTYERK